MPTATLAQSIAAKYNLEPAYVAEILRRTTERRLDGIEVRMDKPCGKSHISDRVLHTDDDCGQGWQGEKGHCVRSKSELTSATHAVASWGAGKIIGGAIAQVASAHGLPPELAKHVAESAVQAFAATALHAKNSRGATPIALAQKLVAEAAGAFSGKATAGFDDAILGGDDHLKELVANVSRQGAKSVIKTHAATLKNIIDRYQGNLRTDAVDHLTGTERSALFDLTVAGWAIAQKLPRQDASPMPTISTTADRLQLATLIGEELQSPTLYGAPIRMRKFNVQGKTVTGEFVGTEDGRSYAFTYANGKVSYQPAVAKLDSESVHQFTVRWDSHTESLESKVAHPVRLDAAGKRLKCGSATYQCGGICQGVHRGCHKNEKAAVDHGRINKINDLIDHLNNGGEHPLKGLAKPDVAQLQQVSSQIQETRHLRAQNLQAGRAGDRMAKAKVQPVQPQAAPMTGVEAMNTIMGRLNKEYDDRKAQTGRPKPATMTVGATVPATKPPQLIPQAAAEARRSVMGFDKVTVPPKAVSPEVLAPVGQPSARSQRLLGNLKTGTEASNRNAAMALAVAQTAVNLKTGGASPPPIGQAAPALGSDKVTPQTARQTAIAAHLPTTGTVHARQAEGGETKAVKPTAIDESGVLVRTFPNDLQKHKSFGNDYVSEQIQKGQRANIFGQQRRVETAEPHTFAKDDYIQAWKDVTGNQRRFLESKGKYADVLANKHKGAVASALRAGKTVPSEVLKDYPDLAAKTVTPKAPHPSSANAAIGRRISHGHVSIDSIAGAIGSLRDRGIGIEGRDAIDLLKGAQDCGCDQCKTRRKRKPEGIVQAGSKVDSAIESAKQRLIERYPHLKARLDEACGEGWQGEKGHCMRSESHPEEPVKGTMPIHTVLGKQLQKAYSRKLLEGDEGTLKRHLAEHIYKRLADFSEETPTYKLLRSEFMKHVDWDAVHDFSQKYSKDPKHSRDEAKEGAATGIVLDYIQGALDQRRENIEDHVKAVKAGDQNHSFHAGILQDSNGSGRDYGKDLAKGQKGQETFKHLLNYGSLWGEHPAPKIVTEALKHIDVAAAMREGLVKHQKAKTVHTDAQAFPDKQAHDQATREAKARFKVFPSRMAGIWLARRYLELVQLKKTHFDAFNRNQLRDHQGRFSKSSGSSDRDTQIKLLAEGGYKARLKKFSENDRRYQMLRGTGKTYKQLLETHGKAHADRALTKHLQALAHDEAVQTYGKGEATLEHDRIRRKGTEAEKARLAAYTALHPESEYMPLSLFQQRNPQAAKTLLDRHAAELKLDQTLSHDAIMARGKAAAVAFERSFKAGDRPEAKMAAATKLRQSLIDDGLSHRNAVQILAKVDHSTLNEADKVQTLGAAHEFFRLSNGAGKKTLAHLVKTDPRASANRLRQEINIGSDGRKDTIWHELGHHVEFEEARIAKAAREWRDRRATGKEKSLNDITGRKGYDQHESALPGNYVHPYVGKTYHDGSTEVVSMGLQFFAQPQTMIYLHDKSPDHFYFILGLLKHD